MRNFRMMAMTAALAAAVWLGGSATTQAQTKSIAGESGAVTLTIVAIEQSTRTLTVKDKDGIFENIVVPKELTRFDQLKVGDTINARYYTNVVVRLKRPGEAAVDVDSAALTRSEGTGPGGTAAMQRTITVVVTAKDPATSSVTVKGPNDYVYSRKVADKKIFEQLKVGDQMDMTWTEAVLISVEPAK